MRALVLTGPLVAAVTGCAAAAGQESESDGRTSRAAVRAGDSDPEPAAADAEDKQWSEVQLNETDGQPGTGETARRKRGEGGQPI